MGILNITPDSFSDGGIYFDSQRAIAHAYEMAEAGADIIDIGAESSRPGSEAISASEELARMVPVLSALQGRLKVPISVDTYKSQVAEAAIGLGAAIINDISGLMADPRMALLLAKHNIPVIIMHMRGTPKTMQQNIHYESFLPEVIMQLKYGISIAEQAGIHPDNIVIDPGIGFGKTVYHNLYLINHLAEFKVLGKPILIGSSRKSFIGQVLNLPPGDPVQPDQREEGTAAAVACGIINGAHIVRVHDVARMGRVARMTDAICRA